PTLSPSALYCSVAPTHLPSVPTRRSSDLRLRRGRRRGPRPRFAGPGDDRLLLRDLLACRLRAPDGEGVSRREPDISVAPSKWRRSEEHTSELQSPDHLVCRLLLEKKNTEH